MQWAVIACLVTHFVIFLLVQRRISLAESWWRWSNAELWLCGLIMLALLHYVFDHKTAANATRLFILLSGIVLGKGAALVARWPGAKFGSHSPIGVERDGSGRVWGIIFVLLLLLAAASWHPATAMEFQYRGQPRWRGLWNNPNLFGLFMGTGIALAFGLAVSSVEQPSLRFGSPKSRASRASEAEKWMMILGKWVIVVLCLVAAILMGCGLMHSYSRGAWMATFCGLGYLAFQVFKCQASGSSKAEISCPSCVSWLKNNWLPAGVIFLSVVVLSFWHFRQTAWRPAHRAFSMGNQNDFSWRNRVAAWEGDLQMMAEKPWFGFGWNQPEPLYEYYYLPPKTIESAAVEMNDCLMLGATLGIPALFCFGTYLWLSLAQTPNLKWGACPPWAQFSAPSRKTSDAQESSNASRHSNMPEAGREARPATPEAGVIPAPDETISEFPTQSMELETTQVYWLRTTCRAGAIVLLVGFWFDGGLFKLATASMFWILLELGWPDQRR